MAKKNSLQMLCKEFRAESQGFEPWYGYKP